MYNEAMQAGHLVTARLEIDYPFERFRQEIKRDYGFDMDIEYRFGPLTPRGNVFDCPVWAASDEHLLQVMCQVRLPDIGEILYIVRLKEVPPDTLG